MDGSTSGKLSNALPGMAFTTSRQFGDLGELLGIGVEHLGIEQQRVGIMLAERGRPMPRLVVEPSRTINPAPSLCAGMIA